jgi:hypothetical protein
VAKIVFSVLSAYVKAVSFANLRKLVICGQFSNFKKKISGAQKEKYPPDYC